MLELKNITKRYQYNKVLDNISMIFPACGLIGIVGASGCGKSTLLHIIGGIDKKYQGEILYNGKKIKRKQIGFLFQLFHFIPWLKMKQNIDLPLFYRRYKYKSYDDDLGVTSHLKQYVYALSLGQRQRAAFLRAISFYPDILLCDEPTASLDQYHATELMELLKKESKKRLVIYISHDKKRVLQYSDEIYEMKDGQIINHNIINTIDHKEQKEKAHHQMKKPGILLSILAMKENKARMIQMMSGIVLSLTTILLTLSLSQGFHTQLNAYIESMIPSSSISFRLKNHQNITDIFSNDSRILHVHLYPDEYELLGISPIADRYSQGISTAIYDDSGYINEDDLLYGRMMNEKNEIVISEMTAIRYLNSHNVEKMINQEIMIWFKYMNEVKGTRVKIVGIADHDMESLYYYQGSHIEMIKNIFLKDDVKSTYGLLYVNDCQEDLKYLNHTYREYEFREVGKSTRENVDSTMEKVKYVLFAFSFLGIISSLFLIGEVMFLEVTCKRKDIAIMRCFGASSFDILCFVFYQSFIVYMMSVLFSYLSFLSLKNFLNSFFKLEMLVDIPLIVIDIKMFIVVYCIGFVLLLISMFIPLIYALKINTVESLKINS